MSEKDRFKFHVGSIIVTRDDRDNDYNYKYYTENGCWKIDCHWPLSYKPGERKWVYGGCQRNQRDGKHKLVAGWDMQQGNDEIGLNGPTLPQYVKDVCKKLAERMFERRDCCE